MTNTRTPSRRIGALPRAVLAAAALAVCAGALPLANAETAPGRRAVDPRTDTLRRLSTVMNLERLDNPVEEVMDLISTRTGADLDVMYLNANNDEGFDPEWTVEMRVGQTTALELIERIVSRANSELNPITEFRWQMDESGAMQIGPKARLNRSRRTVVYDIHDLLFEIPYFDNAPEFDLNTVLQQTGSGGGGQSPFSGGNTQDQDRETKQDQAERLIDLIQTTIEPDEWVDFGGDAASVTYISETLVITAPDYIHREIGGYAFWPKRLQIARVADGRISRDIRPDDRAAP